MRIVMFIVAAVEIIAVLATTGCTGQHGWKFFVGATPVAEIQDIQKLSDKRK